MRRIDTYPYPREIVREMIVNAVVHRDYSYTSSPIQLAVFDERIEITSPGGLAGPVTAETIEDRQYNRNPLIAKRLFEMGYFDSWGQGIDQIMEWARQSGRTLPQCIDRIDVDENRLSC